MLWFLNCGINDVDCCGVRFGGDGDVGSAPSSVEVAAVLVTEALGGSSDFVSAVAAVSWVLPYR